MTYLKVNLLNIKILTEKCAGNVQEIWKECAICSSKSLMTYIVYTLTRTVMPLIIAICA